MTAARTPRSSRFGYDHLKPILLNLFQTADIPYRWIGSVKRQKGSGSCTPKRTLTVAADTPELSCACIGGGISHCVCGVFRHKNHKLEQMFGMGRQKGSIDRQAKRLRKAVIEAAGSRRTGIRQGIQRNLPLCEMGDFRANGIIPAQ